MRSAPTMCGLIRPHASSLSGMPTPTSSAVGSHLLLYLLPNAFAVLVVAAAV